MNRFFFRDQIRDNRQMLEEMLGFNKPEERLCVRIDDTLEKELLAHAPLRDILRRRGLLELADSDATSYWEFAEPSQRLALLPSQTLGLLARRVSAAILADEIARVIAREQVLAIQDFLGPECYRWALTRGRYQIGSLKASLCGLARGETPVQRLSYVARLTLELLASRWPQELQLKTRARLDAIDIEPIDPLTMPALDQEGLKTLWYAARKILQREIDPKWTPYFN